MPSKYRDRAPHYERRRVGKTRFVRGAFVTDKDENGPETDVWCFEDVVKPIRRNIAAADLDREEMDLNPIGFEEMREGVYDPVARLRDMDLNHVEASLCFPQMSRFCGQEFSETKDKELGLVCIQAYNDWMVEEWCATDPQRLIPLIMVPLWDGELAAREIYRNAERGVHAVTFSENPWVLGFEGIHSGAWEPFFSACAETDVTINMHIGSSSKMETVSMGKNERRQAMETAYSRFPILADKRKAPAGSLSGGQQQMLAIAQALMPAPAVLMLDEPSAGLAPSIVKDVFDTVERLKGEGIGILLVEQLVGKAMLLADHVVLLEHGRVALSAPAEEINDLSELREAYMGRGRPEPAPESAPRG